jgi:DNA-binding beta-propeller fold protein YncE
MGQKVPVERPRRDLDTATNAVSSSIDVGKRPWGLALSPDGKMLFAAGGPSNSVVKTIKAGASPWGVIAPAR